MALGSEEANADLKEELEYFKKRKACGRQRHNAKWMAIYNDFVVCHEQGMTMVEIAKRNGISERSIYRYKAYYDEMQKKKKFMQSFVDRIELYPERRKDGNWIKNILFNFSIPVVREDEELARIGGISCGQTSEYPK